MESLEIAMQLLRKTWGRDVVLTADNNLGGSDRSDIFRATVENTDESVVIKRVNVAEGETYDPNNPQGAAFRLFNEWASLHFLDRVADGGAPTPGFIAGDREHGLIVIEDFGDGTRLDQLLLADNADAAQEGLIALFGAVGKVHALTAGKRREFEALRTGLGPVEEKTTQGEGFRRDIKQAGEIFTFDLAAGLSEEIDMIAEFLTNPAPFDVLTHGDPCPDNCLYVDGEMKILDYEFGMFRTAFWDGAFPRIHFPTCWCVSRLPDSVVELAENAYRKEFAQGCAAVNDDHLFYRAMTAHCIRHAFGVTISFHSNLLEEDGEWGLVSQRQRLVRRLDVTAEACERFGEFPAFGTLCRDLVKQLRTVWGDLVGMPFYPAFKRHR